MGGCSGKQRIRSASIVNTRGTHPEVITRRARFVPKKLEEAENRRLIDERKSLNVPYLCLESNELYKRRIELNLRGNQKPFPRSLR